MTKVPARLTRGMNGEKAEEFRKSYLASLIILERIKEVLANELLTAITESEDEERYALPNWELWQADNKGYRRALRKALKLLPSETQENDDGE